MADTLDSIAYQNLDTSLVLDYTEQDDSVLVESVPTENSDLEKEELTAMMSMFFKVIIILVAGIVVWRIIVSYNKKNARPKGGAYFNRKYSDKWKNR